MVIVLMTNSVLYETFLTITARSLFLIFLCINRFFLEKTHGLPFPPPIIECIEALESASPLLKGELYHVLPALCGKGNNATNTLTK